MTELPPAVSRTCLALLGVRARASQRLTVGTRTAVYRVVVHERRSVIVKLYGPTARRNAFTEANAMRAAAHAVAVPAVLGAGRISSSGTTALVTDDLGRERLGDAVRGGVVSRGDALRELGGLLGRLHRLPAGCGFSGRLPPDPVGDLSRRCPQGVMESVAPALATLAAGHSWRPAVWCHGDLHFDNVVLHGPRRDRFLVDFTDAAPAQPEADVAQCLVMAAHGARGRAALLEAYPAELDPQLLEAWEVLCTLRCWTYAPASQIRSLWGKRLAALAERAPHLFRMSRTERSGS